MYIAQNRVISGAFQSATQEASILQVIQRHRTVPLEPQMEKVEVLGNDRSCRSREVEGEGVFDGSEVVQFENELFRKMCFVPPYNPPYANVG